MWGHPSKLLYSAIDPIFSKVKGHSLVAVRLGEFPDAHTVLNRFLKVILSLLE